MKPELMVKSDALLTEDEAAKRLTISVVTLRKMRKNRTGPKHVEIGVLIRYRPRDIEQWIEQHLSGGDECQDKTASIAGD